MKPRPVLVIWNDASLVLDGSRPGALRTLTLGYLVAKRKDGLVIATDWVEGLTDHGEARHFIPTAMIEDWHYLEIED